MAFNLNKLKTKDTTAVQLRDPATDELLYADDAKTQAVQVNIFGPGSSAYRNATLEMQNRQLKRGKKQISAEVLREESVDLLVACTESMENIEHNGAVVTTKEQIKAVYNDPQLGWLKDQVDSALGDIANFLQK